MFVRVLGRPVSPKYASDSAGYPSEARTAAVYRSLSPPSEPPNSSTAGRRAAPADGAGRYRSPYTPSAESVRVRCVTPWVIQRRVSVARVTRPASSRTARSIEKLGSASGYAVRKKKDGEPPAAVPGFIDHTRPIGSTPVQLP